MAFKQLFVMVAGVALGAADAPELPDALAPYVEDGRFDPGDFGYLRGSFEDAGEADKASYESIRKWASACQDEAEREAQRELAARGFAIEEVDGLAGGPALCFQPMFVPQLPEGTTFAQFSEALEEVRPIYETYLMAMRIADNVSAGPPGDIGREIEHRAIPEQMARHALGWGNGETADAPELSPVGLAILRARIGMETVRHDRANTEWLKRVVAEDGWPTISKVGERASSKAWLLAQHADADPVFQLDALRLMEPLAATGEVSKRNYAYLYDRVMLKLAGKQRYATQFQCTDGKFAPQPVEDMAAVARYRAEAGLDPLEEYTRQMEENYGGCR